MTTYKCGHKTNGVIILDENILSMTAYIQWAEEEKQLILKDECFDCFLKRIELKQKLNKEKK